ncbi:MAG: high-potential iron-sulfur protein [Proteobacteria bacterium]|nr:high-potential iron-sulfur protein [Pseudomonadota bacterium]
MSYNRRKFLSVTAGGLATIPLLSITTQTAWAADKLAGNDPMAMALGYFEDAAKTDTTKFPKRAGAEGEKQFCDNCAQYKVTEEGWGTCAIFPGKLVAGRGWCNVWVPIP